jgi:hypothetical protein
MWHGGIHYHPEVLLEVEHLLCESPSLIVEGVFCSGYDACTRKLCQYLITAHGG